MHALVKFLELEVWSRLYLNNHSLLDLHVTAANNIAYTACIRIYIRHNQNTSKSKTVM